MTALLEQRTVRRITWRIVPFIMLLYFIAFIDRVNIGFAALTMNKDLGLSSYIFGLGAGAFFWGYFILEVPSNLILEKVGARRWIGRIMISWGLVSGAFAFTQLPGRRGLQRRNRASSSRIRSSPCKVKISATVAMVLSTPAMPPSLRMRENVARIAATAARIA